jgi:hypothetical protein
MPTTGSVMLTRLRDAVGALNDTHVTDVELYRALTAGVADTWDTLLSMGIGTEGVKKVTFTATAGTSEYALATIVPAGDFFQVSRLVTEDPDGRLRPISRINPSEQYAYRAPQAGATMRLYYFPTAPTFTTGAETFDGINGWEEHAIMCAACYVKAKKEDDTGPFRARKRELELRMAVMANRLRDEPPRIVRRANPYRKGRRNWDYEIPYQTAVQGYDLRGANLELFG